MIGEEGLVSFRAFLNRSVFWKGRFSKGLLFFQSKKIISWKNGAAGIHEDATGISETV